MDGRDAAGHGGRRTPADATSFSTPFSPPLISADVYFYFLDSATGLVTAVQPVRFRPDATVVIEDRIATGDLSLLPAGDPGEARRDSHAAAEPPRRGQSPLGSLTA